MKIAGPLNDALFLERPNRFLTVVEMSGKPVNSHLPDPGRLQELLLPGASLKIRKAENTSGRKTEWTTVMVKSGKQWIPWTALCLTVCGGAASGKGTPHVH